MAYTHPGTEQLLRPAQNNPESDIVYIGLLQIRREPAIAFSDKNVLSIINS